MEIILVRHAQPAWADPSGAAVNDPGLTELGHEQAAALAERCARWQDVTGLYVSTARRSRETAAPLEEALGMTAVVEPWLHEIRLPREWEGTPAQEVGRVLRDARRRPRDEWWDGLPGGESFRDFHHRVTSGFSEALTSWGVTRDNEDPTHLWHLADAEQRVVIVAHAGTNSVLLGHLLGLEPQPWEWERFASDHASLTLVRSTPIASGAIWGLQRFSDVAHFRPDLVTI